MSVSQAVASTALLLAALAAAAPAAADPADDAIKARRAFMTLLGADIRPLAAMARGEADYDPAVAARHAANLQALASYGFTDLFVAGSGNADKPGDTRALPSIWADGSQFGAKAQELRDAVAKFQDVAGEGRGELGGGLGALGATCNACHDDYRAKDF